MSKPNIKIDCEYREIYSLESDTSERKQMDNVPTKVETPDNIYKCIYNGKCVYQSQERIVLSVPDIHSQLPLPIAMGKDGKITAIDSYKDCLHHSADYNLCTLKISELERELNDELFRKGDGANG